MGVGQTVDALRRISTAGGDSGIGHFLFLAYNTRQETTAKKLPKPLGTLMSRTSRTYFSVNAI